MTGIIDSRRIAVFLAAVILFAPALWNGFPLVHYDTAYYWHFAFNRQPESPYLFRPLTYSLFLGWTGSAFVWVFIQGLWLAQLIYQVARIMGLPRRLFLPVMALSALFTPIALCSDFLLPDVFQAVQFLSIFALFHSKGLSRTSRFGFAASFILSSATHFSYLVPCLLALIVFDLRKRSKVLTLTLFAAPILLLPAVHLLAVDDPTWTNAADVLLFSRLTALEISQPYLAERCRTPRWIRICHVRGSGGFPIWDQGPDGQIERLGGLEAIMPEIEEVNREILTSGKYLPIFLARTAENIGRQFFMFSRPLQPDAHDAGVVREAAGLAPFEASMFAKQRLDSINEADLGRWAGILAWIYGTVIGLSVACLGLIFRGMPKTQSRFFIFLGAALAANAIVCGALTEPMDRYQARLIFLLPLFVAYVLLARLTGPESPS